MPQDFDDLLRRALQQVREHIDPAPLYAVLSDAMRLQVLKRLKGTVRHDFVSPYQATAFAIDLLQRQLQQPQGEEQRRRVAQAVDGGKKELARLERAITRVLNEVAAPADEPRRFDLCQLISELHQWMQDEASLLDLQLELRSQQQPVCVEGRPGQIRELLAIVLLNTLDALAAMGTLEIAVQEDGTWAQVLVHAAGLKPDARWGPQMWEPDWAEPRLLTGIGPFVARWTASLHGGDLEVERRAEKGALRVRLPSSAPSEPRG